MTWTTDSGSVDAAGVFTPSRSGIANVKAIPSGRRDIFGTAPISVDGPNNCLLFWVLKIRDDLEFIVKVFGLFLTPIALWVAWKTHAQRSLFDMIDRLYQLPHTLAGNLLKEWELAHLWCIGGQDYAATKAAIESRVWGAQDQNELSRLPELRTKEKIFAIQVFLVYEQIYFQRESSNFFTHKARHEFLTSILDFFHDYLLRNPRLATILRDDRKEKILHLDPAAERYLLEQITKKGKWPERDDGPFQGRSTQDPAQARS